MKLNKNLLTRLAGNFENLHKKVKEIVAIKRHLQNNRY